MRPGSLAGRLPRPTRGARSTGSLSAIGCQAESFGHRAGDPVACLPRLLDFPWPQRRRVVVLATADPGSPHPGIGATSHGRGRPRSQARSPRRPTVSLGRLAQHAQRRRSPRRQPDVSQRSKEQQLRIRVTVAALPSEYRRVLLLRIVSEMPFEEIAERLKRSSAATRQLYQRARRAMLLKLEHQEPR